ETVSFSGVREIAVAISRMTAVSLVVMEQVMAEIDKRLDSLHPALIYDWIFKRGGRESKQEPYCLSDGVGKVSYETALELSRELKLEDCVPSCYQIRFRGFKGVLSVYKNLDSFR
uniref:RNA-dependent RNA polymerase n=1 Tax=Globodera pallida TaxID=36090 RepID=A0A183CR23_GLOPA